MTLYALTLPITRVFKEDNSNFKCKEKQCCQVIYRFII